MGGVSVPSELHSDVSKSAELLSKAIYKFGLTSENLMIKYKKGIVGKNTCNTGLITTVKFLFFWTLFVLSS